jgi:hypothetical protein
MGSGHWLEYARGTYEQRKDTLHLQGFYCNADYSLKKEGGCYTFGAYDERFKIVFKKDSVVNLLSFSNTVPVKLILVKRGTCVAKPL